jgi:hypothetical protein
MKPQIHIDFIIASGLRDATPRNPAKGYATLSADAVIGPP